MTLRRSLLTLALLFAPAACLAAPLGHMVFFTLAEPSDESRDALVAACHKHLSKHEGATHFSVGVLAEDLDRPVNDRGFHVALHLVFKDRASYKTYADHPRHLKFIDEAHELWSNVRVFDSDLTPTADKAVAE